MYFLLNKGLASGPHPTITLRRPAGESQIFSSGSQQMLNPHAIRGGETTASQDITLTVTPGQDKPTYLPVIEPSEDAKHPQQKLPMGLSLPSASDAAYIRSRSVTPSALGAPRDHLARSRKASVRI